MFLQYIDDKGNIKIENVERVEARPDGAFFRIYKNSGEVFYIDIESLLSIYEGK